jgi:cell division transport system permease protein
MKAIRIFVRNIGSAIKSIFRNFSLSLASIICTTITLVIVAIALILSINISNFTENIESSLTIITYVDKKATEEEINTVKSKILEIKNVKGDELIYKDKETIKNETMENSDKNSSLYAIMNTWTAETNPLEPEFIITVRDVTDMENTANTIRQIDKVTNVQYSANIVEKMIPVFKVVQRVALAIILGLVCVTVFLICNTIKLTIYARKSEIEIMRLVGTSNFVIKLPFTIEGLFLGIIGSIVPIVMTIWGYTVAYDKLEGYLFTNFIKMVKPFPFTLYISGILLLIGAVVGMFGSYFTVRRHLKI